MKFRTGVLLFAFVLLCSFGPAAGSLYAAEKWPGVDESVVEKIAKEHGREAHEPLINMDKGDLLLFAFLVAGTVGGFAAGYYWRKLTAERPASAAGQRAAGSKEE